MDKATAFATFSHNGTVGVRSLNKIKVSDNPADILHFLRFEHGGSLRVFWDLDESLSSVFNMLPESVLRALLDGGDTRVGEHELYYLPQRMFGVGQTKFRGTKFYGLKPWFPYGTPEPETLEEVQEKADELMAVLADCGMGNPTKLTSPIACFETTEFGKEVYANLPKDYELPKPVHECVEYAYNCDAREWITAYQLGHWAEGEIWDYDLSAAYSGCAVDLPDLRQMAIWKSDTIGQREQSATMGFLLGDLYIDPESEYQHCSPVVHRLTDKDRPTNYAGTLKDYFITLDEVRFIERYGIGEFTMKDGWFLSPRGSIFPNKPFQTIMEKFYAARSRSPLVAQVMKSLPNQLIGKLAETRRDDNHKGILSSIYHTTILARCRVKVAQFLVDNEITKDELVCVQTDGCRLTRKVWTPEHNGLGHWRCNGSSPTIVASPYRVYVGDKKPYSLTYADFRTAIAKHPMSSQYCADVPRRITLRKAVELGDIGKVGETGEAVARVTIDTLFLEQNRLFDDLPKTGASLLNKFQSRPITT